MAHLYWLKALDLAVVQAFSESLGLHIHFVREAGELIGVAKAQLDIHDASKYTNSEFGAYAKHFHGGGAPREFALAWLHHIHNNNHHWQHWMFPDGYNPKESGTENGIIEMPEKYALEMIADWMGSSKVYTGSWDMTQWLENNAPRIRVHSQTAKFLKEKLGELGYTNIQFAVHQ